MNTDINKELLGEEEYKAPAEQEIVVDSSTNETSNIRELPPLEQIRFAAEKYGIKINDPKPNCKSCYGRGFNGKRIVNPNWEKEKAPLEYEPVPCTCLFTAEVLKQQQQAGTLSNKKSIEKMERQARKMVQKKRVAHRLLDIKAEKELRKKAKRLNKPYELLLIDKLFKSELNKVTKPVEEMADESNNK